MNKRVLFIVFFLCLTGVFAQDEIWMRPNRGQWHENVAYKIGIPGGHLFLEETGFTYSFSTERQHYDHGHEIVDEPETISQHVVKTTFIGAKIPQFQELSPSPFYENYFLSNDQSKWIKNSHAYREIRYQSLYENIDMRLYESSRTLKYDVIVQPGGDPSIFKVKYEGQDKIELKEGALIITTSLNTITESAPYAYQIKSGLKRKVLCNYKLDGNIMSFEFPEGYDKTLPLIIDPELKFSTFTGATSDNWGMTACPDINGNLIGGGIVFGSGYPLSPGAFDVSFSGGDVDLGITKFTEDGGALIFSTFIGGNGSETPHSIIVNEDNDLYIMGATSSTNFPVGGTPYQATNKLGGGAVIDGINFMSGADIYIVKLAAAGNAIIGGTYLGGLGFDGISESGAVVYNYGDQLRGEVVIDAASNVYIASTTNSADFPIVGGFDASIGGVKDAVIAKFNSNLSSLLWSSFVGGSGDESGNALKVSSTGDIFMVGGTTSSNFPNTAGKIHPTYRGGSVDGYLIKFSAPAYTAEATYLGTTDYDQAYCVDLDIDNFVYVYGQSNGNYQTDGINYINTNSGQFIHKISNNLAVTEWSSVFGASGGMAEIAPTAFLVSDCYEIYVAGWGGTLNVDVGAIGSTTFGFPTTPDAYQDVTSGSNFYLAVFTAEMATLKYGTFMGKTDFVRDHVDGGTCRFDKSGTIYHAVCGSCGFTDTGFPVTPGAFAPESGSPNCNMAVFQFDLAKIEAILSTGAPVICIPDPVIFENTSLYGDEYLWIFGDGETSTEFEPTHFYEEPGVYEVMLIVSDAAGCYTPDTAYLEVTIALFEGEAGTLIDTICPGTSVQLWAIGGETYSWGPPEFFDDPTSSDPIVTITEETTFTVTIESVCGLSELEVTVYVYETDVTVCPDTAICFGEFAELSASGGESYNWSPPEFLDDPTSPNPTASPPITTYFGLEVVTEDGCIVTDTVKVQVDLELPRPKLIDEVTICKGDSIRITAGGATDYLWEPDYNITDPTSYNPIVFPNYTTDYYVTFTNACGSVYDTVTVHVIIVEGHASPDTTICPGGSASLWASGGESYYWSPGSYLSNRTSATTVSTPLHDMIYTVLITDEFGCTDQEIVNVYLYDPPSITVSPDVYPIVGDTMTIWAEADGDIVWSPPYNIECITCHSTIVYPERETTYTATVTDEHGCTNLAHVNIYFEPLIFVPNAFTPDGDDFNNVFRAIAHNIDEFEMIIFDRWGQVVYTMESLDDYWDGSYKGSLVVDDVYVWQIVYTDLNGIAYELRGHVVLLK